MNTTTENEIKDGESVLDHALRLASNRSTPVATTEEWRYEFRPDEKYPDLGIYTILAPNPDAGKEGVVYSGKEFRVAETDGEEDAKQIVSDHRLAALVPQLLATLRQLRPHVAVRDIPLIDEALATAKGATE